MTEPMMTVVIKPVTIFDDTCRTNLGRERNQFGQLGPMQQQKVETEIKVEGPALVHAIKRAKRWIRSQRFGKGGGGAPRHIAIMMAAFHKVDPKGFKATLDGQN